MQQKNVTQAKPKVTGAIFVAPEGTEVPTDAKTALAEAFKDLGYVSSDGVTNPKSIETSDIKAWGGDTVLTTQTSFADSFQFTLLEFLNPEVQKLVNGAENVSGTIEAGMTVKVNGADKGSHAFVIDTILAGDVMQRMVIPNGTVSAIGDVAYKDSEAVAYQVTISCLPDENGNNHIEYYAKKGTEA